jgi:asparagine synthetase B (glutamine-hydrolysing)
MLLAIIAHSFIPKDEPIDLLNVSFENPRSMKNSKRNIYDVPDRITGRMGYDELHSKFPERQWQFVEVNVTYQECLEYRQHVLHVMNPLETVMDLSIAIAFWFASRGKGLICNKGETIPYHSRSKVLFSGLGADEQCGGYSRHRAAFEKRGWEGLVIELELDVSRISSRNLGRDDRIVSNHGKEVRFPFLDEPLMVYLSSLPVHLKTDPRLSRQVGDKILLRLLARKFGFDRASVEPKR